MSIDLEYAIKRDIKNNPIVLEIDRQQKREFMRTLSLVALVVVMLIVWAVQHASVQYTGNAIAEKRREQAVEAELNRKLRLELGRLRAPQYLADRAARELHMFMPGSRQTIVLEMLPAQTAGKAIVAAVR
jgi:Cell division protein FtsL